MASRLLELATKYGTGVDTPCGLCWSPMENCPKCEAAAKALQEWTDQQGHDRCWYYPEVFQKLIALFEVRQRQPSQLPPRNEFEEGCRKYQDEEYGTD